MFSKTVHAIPRQRAIDFLWNDLENRIFGCHFIKKDGTMRSMVARRGVRKYLAGGDLPYDARQKLILPVFDMHAKAYRSVNLAGLVSFEIGGEVFLVVD